MSKRKRNIDFMSVRKEKFEHIKGIFRAYLDQVYEVGEKHDLNSVYTGFDKNIMDELGDILYEGYISSIKATNNAMNAVADYCNDKEIALPFALVYKLQAFLEVMTMVEYMMAVDYRKLLGSDISIDDQCEIFEGTIEKGFSSLRNSDDIPQNADDQNNFYKFEKLISSDTAPEEIAKEFSKDVHSIDTKDLVYIISKLQSLIFLSSSLTSKSAELARMESVVSLIVKVSRDEISRRRENN